MERIRENLDLAGVTSKVRLFPVALGGAEDKGYLFCSEMNAQENYLQGYMSFPTSPMPERTVEVPVYTLDRLLSELGWKTVKVMKRDCEGCEYAILGQTAEAILRRVQMWIMEFHRGAKPLMEGFKSVGYEVEYEEYPDRLGMLLACLSGAPLPWSG